MTTHLFSSLSRHSLFRGFRLLWLFGVLGSSWSRYDDDDDDEDDEEDVS